MSSSRMKYVPIRHPTSTLATVLVHPLLVPQKSVSEIVAGIEKTKESQMSSEKPILPPSTQDAPDTTSAGASESSVREEPSVPPAPSTQDAPDTTSPGAPEPVVVSPPSTLPESLVDNVREMIVETTGGLVETAANSVVSSLGIKIEGEFASKDTERVSSVIAEGISFLRENAERITLKITNGESPMIVTAIELAQWSERAMKGFSGLERKDVVIRLLNWLIDNQEDVLLNALGENKEDLRHIVADVVPSVLDMVCAAAKGKLDLNKATEVATKCCVWWWSKRT